MRKKNNEIKLDVLIVGAGFGGMYMLHKLRELGLEALIVEAGDGVGLHTQVGKNSSTRSISHANGQ